ncbi:MAG: carbon-nitrogen hydrolase family protein [Alphaproteobacteria bacterium]
MTATFTAACIQNEGLADMDASVAAATELVRAARAEGAELICLPEYFACYKSADTEVVLGPHAEPAHPALTHFRGLAEELGAWLLLGSLAITAGPGKIFNRSYLVTPAGAVAARYDKVHLFDVDLAGGESYRESALIEPGGRAVLAATPWATLGLTVCYDLRFPQLYRALAKAGAEVLTVPAAFTKTSGQAHWHVLLRARAIETGCFVLAPCQCGDHGGGRETYGHSLIVDPWGRVLAEGGEEAGYITAEIDLAEVAKARAMIPALDHDRDFDSPEAGEAEPAAQAASV